MTCADQVLSPSGTLALLNRTVVVNGWLSAQVGNVLIL